MNRSTLKSWDEAALVRAAREGCDETFSILIDRYRRVVFGTVWSALQDFDDAEDATQEAFVLAFRHLSDLKDPTRFSSWIYSIAKSVVHKWLGKRALNRHRFIRLEEVSEVVEDRAEDRVEEYHPEELREAFEVLSPEDREATTLFYLVGLTQQQTAELLSIPVGTVKSRLHRSRNTLKRRLLDMAKEHFQDQAPCEDYSRAVIGGMRGVFHWKKLIEKEGLAGWRPERGSESEEAWSRSDETIIGEDMDGTGERLIIGDASWKDYELSVLITPMSGGNAQVQFGLSEDGQCYYMLDMLLGWQAVSVSKVDMRPGASGLQKLDVVNFPIERGREYDVLIATREASITTYIDGKLMNQLTDFSYRSGPIALNVWQSKTSFRDPRIRLYTS